MAAKKNPYAYLVSRIPAKVIKSKKTYDRKKKHKDKEV